MLKAAFTSSARSALRIIIEECNLNYKNYLTRKKECAICRKTVENRRLTKDDYSIRNISTKFIYISKLLYPKYTRVHGGRRNIKYITVEKVLWQEYVLLFFTI